jgi:hypothetical protein
MDVLLTLPGGTGVDGAVVELRQEPDGPWHVAADVRIPAPVKD